MQHQRTPEKKRTLLGCSLGLAILALLFVPAYCAAFYTAPESVRLTQQEQAYVRENKKVTLCVDPDWVPFEQINAGGRHAGIAADLLELVAERTGLEFELVPTRDWNESLTFSKSGRCKVLSFLNQTTERSEWLIFTAPLFSDPNVFITREEHPFIADPASLEHESIVFPVGTAMEELVRERYPNLLIKHAASEDIAMDMVSNRQASMTLRSLIVAAYTIRKHGLFNLKIAGQLPMYMNHLRIGVSKNEVVLRNILNKGVLSVTAQERGRAVNQHVSINVQSAVDPRWMFCGGAVLGLIALLWGYWTYRLRRLNAALLRISSTDMLTGIANRLKLSGDLENAMARARKFKTPLCVVLLDVDNFKNVNDTHGHLVGDMVLKDLSSVTSAALRSGDLIGRWGGEEFLALLPGVAAGEAAQIAERLRVNICEHVFVNGLRCTVSMGVAEMHRDDTQDSLTHRADQALYKAKRSGKNRVACG